MYELMEKFTGECVDECMDECMHERIAACMDGCVERYLRMDERMYTWMNGWVHARMSALQLRVAETFQDIPSDEDVEKQQLAILASFESFQNANAA